MSAFADALRCDGPESSLPPAAETREGPTPTTRPPAVTLSDFSAAMLSPVVKQLFVDPEHEASVVTVQRGLVRGSSAIEPPLAAEPFVSIDTSDVVPSSNLHRIRSLEAFVGTWPHPALPSE